MKKFLLIGFLIFDVALVVGGSFVLLTYIRDKTTRPRLQTVNAAPYQGGSSTASVKLGGGELLPTPGATTAESSVRKILFAYRNSKVKQVAIRADFTGWKAEPMKEEAGGKWTYLAHLTPGEYAYCFTLGGDKIINDPANKRTKVIGRTTVSSIVVEPLPAKPAN